MTPAAGVLASLLPVPGPAGPACRAAGGTRPASAVKPTPRLSRWMSFRQAVAGVCWIAIFTAGNAFRCPDGVWFPQRCRAAVRSLARREGVAYFGLVVGHRLAGRPNAGNIDGCSKAAMSVRPPFSMRSTASTNGKNAAWPGRRRYPAVPGCLLAVIGSSRHWPREVMPSRRASPTSCRPFHSPTWGEMASRTSWRSRAISASGSACSCAAMKRWSRRRCPESGSAAGAQSSRPSGH